MGFDHVSLLLGQVSVWGAAGMCLASLLYWATHPRKRHKKAPPPPLGVGTGHRPPQGGSGTAPAKGEDWEHVAVARILQLEADLEKLKALRVGYFDRERRLLDEVSSLKAVITAFRQDADASAEIMLRRRWGVVRHRYGKNTWAVLTEGCTPAEGEAVRASAADTPSEALRKADEWWKEHVDSKTKEAT